MANYRIYKMSVEEEKKAIYCKSLLSHKEKQRNKHNTQMETKRTTAQEKNTQN